LIALMNQQLEEQYLTLLFYFKIYVGKNNFNPI
ncbi:MAG: hypothetical protein RL065_236, partial [Bacteroidota bacterium]